MSALISFTEASPRQSGAAHCGKPMDLVTPALGVAGAGYTFTPEISPREVLPPVWRCQCGFQLDAWFPSADAFPEPAGTYATAQTAAHCG